MLRAKDLKILGPSGWKTRKQDRRNTHKAAHAAFGEEGEALGRLEVSEGPPKSHHDSTARFPLADPRD
jgi:hypothetical protein